MFAAMTVNEALTHVSVQLQTIYDRGEANAIAEWLLEDLTGIDRKARVDQRLAQLSSEQESQLVNRLERLLRHEPLHYVLNEAWFCGLRFHVDQSVLIPRPETEELVEWIVSVCEKTNDRPRVLDVGTGSGCIAVSLKRKLPQAETWACDISADALKVAEQNALSHDANIRFRQIDFLDKAAWTDLPGFDLIVSNPPYVPPADKKDMHKNVIGFEPHIALFAPGEDALIFYRAIAEFAQTHLAAGGKIFVETHEQMSEAVKEIFTSAGFSAEGKNDMQGKARMCMVSSAGGS